jgi:hypothetical protein
VWAEDQLEMIGRVYICRRTGLYRLSTWMRYSITDLATRTFLPRPSPPMTALIDRESVAVQSIQPTTLFAQVPNSTATLLSSVSFSHCYLHLLLLALYKYPDVFGNSANRASRVSHQKEEVVKPRPFSISPNPSSSSSWALAGAGMDSAYVAPSPSSQDFEY